HRRRVGRGREPGPLDPKSCYACWMVMPTQVRDFKGERVPHPSFLRVGPFFVQLSRVPHPLALPALSLEGRIEGSQSEGSFLRVGPFCFFYFSEFSLAGFTPSSTRDATSFCGCPTLRF